MKSDLEDASVNFYPYYKLYYTEVILHLIAQLETKKEGV